MVRQTSPSQPGAPEARRRGESCVGLVDVGWHREALGPRERAVGLIALLEDVPGPHPVALDSDRHVGLQPDRLVGPAGVGCVPVSIDHRPLGRHATVVEDGLADQLHLDAAVEAEHRAHEHVVAVVVGRRPRVRSDLVLAASRPHRERVPDQDPAASASSTSS